MALETDAKGVLTDISQKAMPNRVQLRLIRKYFALLNTISDVFNIRIGLNSVSTQLYISDIFSRYYQYRKQGEKVRSVTTEIIAPAFIILQTNGLLTLIWSMF
jgi:hypothetical protein